MQTTARLRNSMVNRINIATGSKVELQDITLEVQKIINSSGILSGICHLFVPHTTAGITVNEHADPSVVRDISTQLDVLIPQHQSYLHREGNSPAHIKASLMGNSETLIIDDGKLVLGIWQGIFFCEFDGPRSRSLLIKVIADKH